LILVIPDGPSCRGDSPVAEHDAVNSIPKSEHGKATSAETTASPTGVFPAMTAQGPATAQTVSLIGGLAVLGLLAAVVVLLDSSTGGNGTQAALVASWLRAIWLVLAFALAGSAAFIAVRRLSLLLRELLDRESRRSRQIEHGLGHAIQLLERIAQGIEQRAHSAVLGPPAAAAQAYPVKTVEDWTAELKAAREANDPTRVLEIFQTIAPELEGEPRRVLQTEIAEWFITVIYRRLRTGKIQAEVVELAGRFAESFASTAQGASVRAALPMLRRSAGLCPRCIKPYTGTGQACPECLRSGNTTSVPDLPSVDPDLPE
jgi:hypothetical protein